MFLAEANKASVEVSDELIEEFGEACKEAFKKQFTDKRKKEFWKKKRSPERKIIFSGTMYRPGQVDDKRKRVYLNPACTISVCIE